MKKRRMVSLLVMACMFVCSFAQQKVTLSGLVKDTNGEPLFAVAVAVKGTSNGTYTDEKGAYSLSVAKGKILKFSREKDGECSGNGAVYAGGLVGFNEGGIVCTCCTDSSDASIGGGTEGHTTQISVEGCTHN